MPITTDDVRKTLADITTDLLPDTTVRQALRLANTKINLIKRANIPVQDSDSAVLMYASFLAYQMYTTKIVRQLGSVPLDVQQTLVMLRVTAEEYINEIRWNKKGKPIIGVTYGVKQDAGVSEELYYEE